MKNETKALAERIAAVLDNKKGLDIQTLDISEIADIAECFIVASGTTNIHARALADAVMENLEKDDINPIRMEGYDAGQWIILDYGDIMVHVFRDEERGFYNLERLWLQEKNFSFFKESADAE